MRKASRQPNKQREQSQVNLNSAESRMRKTSRQMPAEWALEVFDKAPYNDSVAGIKEAIQRPYRL